MTTMKTKRRFDSSSSGLIGSALYLEKDPFAAAVDLVEICLKLIVFVLPRRLEYTDYCFYL